MKIPLLVLLLCATASAQKTWVSTSLSRVYPISLPSDVKSLDIPAPRGGTVSFQACVRNESTAPMRVKCEVAGDLKTMVRRVGFVPMAHHTIETDAKELEGVGFVPGLVPDPLFPETEATVGPLENAAFWITVTVPAEAEPGKHVLKVALTSNKKPLGELLANVDVSKLVLQPRRDFPVTHWWRIEAIWDFYKTEPFDERCWELTRKYLTDIRQHGSDAIYVPLFFMRREIFKRPAQLLEVKQTGTDQFAFDFARTRRFIKLARECGFEKFEWPHLWIYWGVEHPIRVYTPRDGKMTLLWPEDSPPTTGVYRKFLEQFLPQFHEFLISENALENSYFHLSDEPGSEKHVENYRRARELLRELAPWMKVIDALSDVRYGREHLTDHPIPLVNAAQAYIDEKIPHWVYYCCAPRGPWLNRFMDTPLAKIRMSGFAFYKLQAQGFLHWGYNYWHAMERETLLDPFTEGAGESWPGIPYGDPFVVYPGKDGPIDSIRWEVFAEALQDYAILQTAGIKPDDEMLKDIHTYADFPKDPHWIDHTVRKLLSP